MAMLAKNRVDAVKQLVVMQFRQMLALV